MRNVPNPRYQYCERVDKSVSVCRSQSDCRRANGCTQPLCPLQRAFDPKDFDQRMRAFAAAFDLWPLQPCEV